MRLWSWCSKWWKLGFCFCFCWWIPLAQCNWRKLKKLPNFVGFYSNLTSTSSYLESLFDISRLQSVPSSGEKKIQKLFVSATFCSVIWRWTIERLNWIEQITNDWDETLLKQFASLTECVIIFFFHLHFARF